MSHMRANWPQTLALQEKISHLVLMEPLTLFLLLVTQPPHLGVSLAYAKLCHRTLRTGVVCEEDASPHTQDFPRCVDPDVLQVAIRNRGDIRNDRDDNSTRAFRKAAYRQFLLDRYGYLGKGNRKVCPSCVVTIISRHYPSQTGVYMGFRAEWRTLILQ